MLTVKIFGADLPEAEQIIEVVKTTAREYGVKDFDFDGGPSISPFYEDQIEPGVPVDIVVDIKGASTELHSILIRSVAQSVPDFVVVVI